MKTIFTFIILLSFSCGTKNATEDRDEKTTDEKIRVALDAEDLETAQQLLEEQIEAYPEEYERYTILGAVYAAQAGFDLLAAVQSAGSSSTSNPIDQVGLFLTEETTEENLEFMNQ